MWQVKRRRVVSFNPWDDEEDEDEDDDLDNDDPFGDDNEDPYGVDEDPQEQDDEEGDEGEDEGEEKKKKKKDDDGDDKGDIAAKISGKGKKPSRKQMDTQAKALNLLPIPGPLAKVVRCPECKEDSLYLDTVMSTGVRITVAIVKGIIGCDNMEKDLNVLRFCCLNKKCNGYYKRTGTKYKINTTGSPLPLVIERHYFHADI